MALIINFWWFLLTYDQVKARPMKNIYIAGSIFWQRSKGWLCIRVRQEWGHTTQHKPSCDLTIFFRQYDAVCDKLRRSMSFFSSLHSGFSLKAVWASTISFWGILSSWKKRYCKHSAEFIFNKHLLKMNSNKRYVLKMFWPVFWVYRGTVNTVTTVFTPEWVI